MMYKYQLSKLTKRRSGKIKRSILLEDILTSDVFGLISYLEFEFGLKRFLSKVNQINKPHVMQIPVPSELKHSTKFYFWPSLPCSEYVREKYKQSSIEPDVLIVCNELSIMIEAKAKILKISDIKEFVREYLVGNEYAKEHDLTNHLLLIDSSFVKPCVIEDIIAYLVKEEHIDRKEIENCLLWCNWQTLYTLVTEYSATSSKFDVVKLKDIADDLIHILDRKGLRPFEKLDLRKISQYKFASQKVMGVVKGGIMSNDAILKQTGNQLNEAINVLKLIYEQVYSNLKIIDDVLRSDRNLINNMGIIWQSISQEANRGWETWLLRYFGICLASSRITKESISRKEHNAIVFILIILEQTDDTPLLYYGKIKNLKIVPKKKAPSEYFRNIFEMFCKADNRKSPYVLPPNNWCEATIEFEALPFIALASADDKQKKLMTDKIYDYCMK